MDFGTEIRTTSKWLCIVSLSFHTDTIRAPGSSHRPHMKISAWCQNFLPLARITCIYHNYTSYKYSVAFWVGSLFFKFSIAMACTFWLHLPTNFFMHNVHTGLTSFSPLLKKTKSPVYYPRIWEMLTALSLLWNVHCLQEPEAIAVIYMAFHSLYVKMITFTTFGL